jgi:glutamate 5-kinase
MRQALELKEKHAIETVWVTSGAITSGRERLGLGTKPPREFNEKQALSAVGQPALMELYNSALAASGGRGAQILVTSHDLSRREGRRELLATLEILLGWGVVPIVNENDVAMRRNNKFRDNDWLSLLLARMIGAHRLILLTDVEGLFSADPATNPEAEIVHRLDRVTAPMLRKLSKSAGSAQSAGGMHSKLAAAKEAASKGIETWLVRGDTRDALGRIHRGTRIGTRVAARAGARAR